mmetsp:Transcript_3563/g.11121  ORF Transcript_3563/g.11121 Transcript_3563/m.11121 type:complete len:221 (+) Transcript_3563:1653-2315(+)
MRDLPERAAVHVGIVQRQLYLELVVRRFDADVRAADVLRPHAVSTRRVRDPLRWVGRERRRVVDGIVAAAPGADESELAEGAVPAVDVAAHAELADEDEANRRRPRPGADAEDVVHDGVQPRVHIVHRADRVEAREVARLLERLLHEVVGAERVEVDAVGEADEAQREDGDAEEKEDAELAPLLVLAVRPEEQLVGADDVVRLALAARAEAPQRDEVVND